LGQEMEKNIRRLWGQDFPLVSQGLSESAVVAFVNKLMEERESVAKREESLISLRQLAEKMVVEASEMAATIKKQAEAEANALMDAAKSRADEITNETAQTMSEIKAKADDIMHKAQQEADLIKTQTSQEFEQELNVISAKFCQQIEALEHRIVQELWDELNNLFQSMTKVRTGYQGKWIDDIQELVANRLEPAKTPEDMSINTMESVATIPIQFEEQDKNNGLSPEAGVVDKCQTLEADLSASLVDTQESLNASELQCYEGEIEIFVAPPVHAGKLLKLTNELESNPRILIRKVDNSSGGPYSISLLLKKPVALVAMLKSIGGITIRDTPGDGMQSGETKRLNIQIAR